ncbi:alanine--tRNA ligase, mitochondrial [Aricia agestis]|uniref:alanine--tRNA ligase, mitochondrial n=1 Tax=Aricia agestis TaxID=91739 RepID=UPI001C20B50D|nr:alanine--tRNA ligase, mitochondrial [Aricia agestis]
MLRLRGFTGNMKINIPKRLLSSSSHIRTTFVDHFVQQHNHKYVKSSSVVPLYDPSVPFVNAGMNQFKSIFLGVIDPPYPRAVNSQKCVRVGGKHNDLNLVGLDGHHHTFFEMLGNWSFGDYYKKEACQMAWELLLGPYRLKPEELLVTYFGGDSVLGLPEDRECRDVWRQIGVPDSHIKGLSASDNFWEMGATGPCGPCTEIHYINPDGSLTEIWNIVFIQFNREARGSVRPLSKVHIDTGLGLERLTTLLQKVPSNYDTDLFKPIIKSIEQNSKNMSPYCGSYSQDATVDQAYRRLADHSRMISVCLADGVFPSTSLNLKQIMRRAFKLSSDVFKNPKLLIHLYDHVADILGETYPELVARQKDAKLVIEQEMEGYAKLRSDLAKKWKDLTKRYPEVESMSDVEMAGFALGYKEFKETMSKTDSKIPGELVFKLYDTHGFQEDIIERIAKLNNLELDKRGFMKLLADHKSRHKTALKEQANTKGVLFDKVIEDIVKKGIKQTNDQPKYDYIHKDNEIYFEPLKTKVIALLNEDIEWLDFAEPSIDRPYYVVTESTNFYCEEGGQLADTGQILFSGNINFKVNSVFKIRNFVFHKGHFELSKTDSQYVDNKSEVVLEIDNSRRLSIMRNHTGIHLLNAAIRKVLPNSVVCQIGSSVTDRGLCLNLSVYGEKLSQDVILKAQQLVRESINSNAPVQTQILNSTQLSLEQDVLTVPGETYPESGLRMVTCFPPLPSKELCCGTHVSSTGALRDVCVTSVRAAGSRSPAVMAVTGDAAIQARELFCRAQNLSQVAELADFEQVREEAGSIRRELAELCGGGKPCGEYADCIQLLDRCVKRAQSSDNTDGALEAIAKAEISEAISEAGASGRRFAVHFLRCAYLMPAGGVRRLLTVPPPCPALLLACAGGVIVATAHVPQELVTSKFTASSWLGCVVPVFGAGVERAAAPHTFAEMTATKVSLITCEQLVQDAMRVAIKFAQSHLCAADDNTRDTRQN